MQMHNLIDVARCAAPPANHPAAHLLTDLVAQLNRHAITPYQFAHRLVTDHDFRSRCLYLSSSLLPILIPDP